MNNLKRVFPVVLAVVMLFSVMCTGWAASAAATPATQTIEAVAGETVTLRLAESDCYGMSGNITYSNRALFSSVTPGEYSGGILRENKFNIHTEEKGEKSLILKAKISDTAAVGSTCVVTFSDYLRVDNKEDLSGPEGLEKKITVKVIEKPTTTKKPTTTTTTKKPTTTTTTKKPTTTTTTKKPTTTAPTTTQKPADGKVDLTELNKQIGIAESLNKNDYTVDSWAAMQTALDAAKDARSETSQSAINTAATTLKKAIAALVRVDAETLTALIANAKKYMQENELSALWDAVAAAIENAETALKSGNQEAIAKANAELEAALAAYKTKLEELGKGEIIDNDKPVEVLPDYDYLYLGDNARAPYGTRSFDVVYEFTLQAVRYLFAQGCQCQYGGW